MNENTIPLAEKPEDVTLREGNVITHQQTPDGWVPYRGSRVLTMDHYQWAEYRDHIVARGITRECPCCRFRRTYGILCLHPFLGEICFLAIVKSVMGLERFRLWF
jgi:hypothetical protein